MLENYDLLLLPKTDRYATDTIHCFTRCNTPRPDDHSLKALRPWLKIDSAL